MNRVIESERIPIKLWADGIDDNAMNQIVNLANLPFAFSHIAVMPDAHAGYGMPIGGVLATRDAIIPNAVGVDIGCGMCALRTSLKELDRDDLKRILSDIRMVIPVGFRHRKHAQNTDLMPQGYSLKNMPIACKEYDSALHQLGTLGGGNHFIEIQKGSDGYLWLMIHSGSRNIGKKVAEYYNLKAKNLSADLAHKIPQNYDLAYLPAEHELGKKYLNEMSFCLEFAKANRDFMMNKIKDVLKEYRQCSFDAYINIHHNYAILEEHFSKKVFVHRKGATAAWVGQFGIIPGSQGTSSYIVEGKGNVQSFCSCSHGAGRKMGRRQAQRELDLNYEINRLEDKGIMHSIRSRRDLDEATSAYKDIERVMAAQDDLVDVKVKLEPLAVIKG